MKIKINSGKLTYEELKKKLSEKFPYYEFNTRSKNFLVAKKSSTIGTNILLKKDKIIVVGNFPTIAGTMIFMLTVILLGVLIPIIVYFSAFHSKMMKVEKEIGNFLNDEYGIKQT